MPVKPSYLLLAGGGAVIAYSGLRGKSVSSAFRDVIAGQSPKDALAANSIVGGSAGNAGGGMTFSGDSSAIASDALRYEGLGYVWGGNGSKPGIWDCSSYFTYVANHDLGIAVPGYKPHTFGGHGHGPTVAVYRFWKGAHTVTTPQPGDYVCFGISHMGIYLGNGKMISALNPSLGTRVTSVFSNPLYRRVG
jgi:peptidoglycan DL-endopeptidase CwlO